MCETYQQAVERDCPCRYTLRMVVAEMAEQSRPYRRVAGWLIKAVGAAIVGAAMVIGWVLAGAVWVAVWAYNDMFPLVEAPAPAAPVEPMAPKAAPVYAWDLSSMKIKVSRDR